MATIYGERDDGHPDSVSTFDYRPVAKTPGPLLDILARHDIRALLFYRGTPFGHPGGAGRTQG